MTDDQKFTLETLAREIEYATKDIQNHPDGEVQSALGLLESTTKKLREVIAEAGPPNAVTESEPAATEADTTSNNGVTLVDALEIDPPNIDPPRSKFDDWKCTLAFTLPVDKNDEAQRLLVTFPIDVEIVSRLAVDFETMAGDFASEAEDTEFRGDDEEN